MVTLFFRPGPVRSFAEAAESATGRFAAYHAHCLSSGVYLPPSQFEAAFVSLAHDDAAIDAVLAAARAFFQGVDDR
jgi:glutamate-1-semialdehyde 2,1-aminomutase